SGLNRKVEAATAKIAFDVESAWKANIQAAELIDSGTYLDSVQARQLGPADWVVQTGLIDPPYPVFLEYGTSRGIQAYGVATAAADANRDAYAQAIAQALGEL